MVAQRRGRAYLCFHGSKGDDEAHGFTGRAESNFRHDQRETHRPWTMIDRIVIYQQVTTGLLVAQPNWDTGLKVTLDLPTDVSRQPITLKESRRNFAQSARYSMQWRSYLSNAADAEELRIFLTRIRGEPVMVPMWPDMCSLQEPFDVPFHSTHIRVNELPVRYGSPWIIANSDFSVWEIVSVSSINFTTNTI